MAEDGGKTTSWDSTIAPGKSRSYRIAPGELRGEPGEAVNLELVYVYIGSEFPRLYVAPDEPATRSILRRRAAADELPLCDR